MGSYGGISFDDLSICESKSYIPDDWAVLFQETDRQYGNRQCEDAESDDEHCSFVWYETERETFLLRLSLLGATESAVKHTFDMWLVDELKNWEACANEWDGEAGARAKEVQAEIASLDFESWKAHANQTLRTRYKFEDPFQPSNEIEKRFHDSNESYLHIAGYGELVSIRALLEACPEVKVVKLDVSDLIASGYYNDTDEICTNARKEFSFSQLLGPSIILGEGSTDLLVLKRGLMAMYPALVDYFSFFDHVEFNVDGGASYLVKFLKAFAAANVIGRFVAIFDNDAVGLQALEQATALKLPGHFLLLRLPDIEIARSYPTVGPSGPAELDVNGSAAGIELYLGREALEVAGALRTVRWAGYVQTARKYQGEVEGKADVLAAFLAKINVVKNPEEARVAFPELKKIWQTIFEMVKDHAGEQYLYRYAQHLREDV